VIASGGMKRTGFLKRRTPLASKGKSDTAKIKDDIQALLRAIVIQRDRGCILRGVHGVSPCNGFNSASDLILQADHLITRANSATYSDYRLVVCVCKGHHRWKKWHEREYNALLKTILPSERVALWEECEKDSWKPHRTSAHDNKEPGPCGPGPFVSRPRHLTRPTCAASRDRWQTDREDGNSAAPAHQGGIVSDESSRSIEVPLDSRQNLAAIGHTGNIGHFTKLQRAGPFSSATIEARSRRVRRSSFTHRGNG
jgi:hypothetical protein